MVMSLQLSQCSKIWQNVLFIEGALFASKEKNQKEWLRFSLLGTAGLNVDLDSFFELAELMVEMSQGTYGLLKINN